MDASGTNQPGLNISFNPMSSGSIAATNSSGYTAVNSEDTDPELTYQSSLVPQSYDSGQHVKPYQFTHNSPSSVAQNRMWNSRSNSTTSPGLASSPSTINSMISSPRSDSQGIHLPSFMNSSIFDATNARQTPQGGTGHNSQFNQVDYNNISSMKSNNKEPVANSPQYANYGHNVPSQIMASYQRKKQLSMNPNGSSYSSSMASVASYENRSVSSDAKGNSLNAIEKATKPSSYAGTTPFENSESETIEMLKSELSFKNQVNDSLKVKLKFLTLDDEMSVPDDDNRLGDQMRMPKNFIQLFRDLMRTLNERTQELKETKTKIEAIVVGTIITKVDAVDYYENFDAQDIAHRITNKLSVLQTENEALLTMVSHSNKQSLLIELGLLKNENKLLKEKLDKMGLDT